MVFYSIMNRDTFFDTEITQSPRQEITYRSDIVPHDIFRFSDRIKKIVLEDLKSKISKFFLIPVITVQLNFDKNYLINYFEVILDMDAKQALESWIKIIPFVRLLNIKLPIFVKWAGKTNVTPTEFGSYVGKAFSLMNIGFRTKESMDSVKLIKAFRGERI